jgi:ribosome maturation factor RimP
MPLTPVKADAIDVTVTGLGYDLVEVERLPRGLLRVTIDRLPGRVYGTPGAPDTGEFITVEDCERVTRQLQYALEVAEVAYERLEVSSPGLDRLLKTEAHCQRFVGEAVNLTLKLPFQGRKHWTGLLLAGEVDADGGAAGWRLVVTDVKKDNRKDSRKPGRQESPTESALDFQFDEARELRLVPVVDFKGRRPKNALNEAPDELQDEQVVAAPAADASTNGEQDR